VCWVLYTGELYKTVEPTEMMFAGHGRQRHCNIAGGSQVERRRRENRGAVGGKGVGLGRGCAPSQKIYDFFVSKWCDMVHFWVCCFLRFVCPMDCSCMINFIEVPVCENDSDVRYSELPLKGKNKTSVKILGGRQHRTTPAGQMLGGGCYP